MARPLAPPRGPPGRRRSARTLTSRTRRTAPGRLFDRLFPPACVLCRRLLPAGRAPLCGLCRHRLPAVFPPWCPRCGATRRLEVPGVRGCPQCRDWPRRGPPAAAPFRMEGDAARLVRALKFGGWFALARPMGRAMATGARRLARRGPGPALLVPVPASRARWRERGFNQAELLARSLSRAVGWPQRSLLTRRGGRRQARLGRRERAANVEGRFLLREGAPGPAEGPVLLVDDVVTTGATAGACAAALRAGGTRVLGTVAFARALHALGDGP